MDLSAWSHDRQLPRARLLVCEKNGDWAVGLRNLAGDGGPRVWQVRSPADCLDGLRTSPASVVAVEATAGNLGAVAGLLCRVTREFRAARTIILAARGLEDHQWWLREAGAVHVVFSVRGLEAVLRVARRHLAAAGAAEPAPLGELPVHLPAAWERITPAS
jgi:DNA-binding response OmpR family regulator